MEPSNNRSALCMGRWKEIWGHGSEAYLTDHQGVSLWKLHSWGLSGWTISPSLIRQCQAVKRIARKSLSSCEEVGDMVLHTSFKLFSVRACFLLAEDPRNFWHPARVFEMMVEVWIDRMLGQIDSSSEQMPDR